jgi:hypothetical protein
MRTDDIKLMIDQYIDGELEKAKEPILFTMLSSDSDARDYFKTVNYLRNNFLQNSTEYPARLDERILHSVESAQPKQSTVFTNKNIFLFFSYTLVAALLLISLNFYKQSEQFKKQSEDYKAQFINLTYEVKKQNADLQLILNAMPEIEVRSGYYRTKEVVVNAKL